MSAARVPLARRFLSAHVLRTWAGAAGIGLGLMLMLLLTGLWAGVQQRVTVYDDHTGADLVVVPAGSQSMFADAGLLDPETVEAVAEQPGVATASPLRTMYEILELHDGKAATAVAAFDPASGLGGPWRLARGRAPAGSGEVAIDAVFAGRHNLAVGDRLPMLGHPMRIVGLTNGTSMFMTPLVFTTVDGMNSMLRTPGAAGAVLVTTDDPVGVARQLRVAGYTVRTPDQLHSGSLQLATRIYGAPVRLMVAVAFAAGTLIVALVAYTRVSEQGRELGVLKALGAPPARLRLVALAETTALTALGALAAVLWLLLARELLAWWRPAFPVLLTSRTLLQTAAAATAMSLLGAWLPLRRLNRIDAATAFRGAR